MIDCKSVTWIRRNLLVIENTCCFSERNSCKNTSRGKKTEPMRPECCAMRTFLTYVYVQLSPNILSGIMIVNSSGNEPSSPIISSALPNNWTCTIFGIIQKTYLILILLNHLFCSLSYDRSKASSKASSPYSAIQSFLFQMRVSSPFLKVIQ